MNFLHSAERPASAERLREGLVTIGAVGVVVVGILCFGEAATWPRLASMALILVGIAGLKFFSA